MDVLAQVVDVLSASLDSHLPRTASAVVADPRSRISVTKAARDAIAEVVTTDLALRLAVNATRTVVPEGETVSSVVAARLDSLGPTARVLVTFTTSSGIEQHIATFRR